METEVGSPHYCGFADAHFERPAIPNCWLKINSKRFASNGFIVEEFMTEQEVHEYMIGYREGKK